MDTVLIIDYGGPHLIISICKKGISVWLHPEANHGSFLFLLYFSLYIKIVLLAMIVTGSVFSPF